MLTAFQPYVEVFGALVQSGTPSHRRIGICAFDEVLENLEGMHSLLCFFFLYNSVCLLDFSASCEIISSLPVRLRVWPLSGVKCQHTH